MLVSLLEGFPLGACLLRGHVADLVTEGGEGVGIKWVEHGAPAVMHGFEGGDGGGWISGPGGGVKKSPTKHKTLTFVRHGILWIQSRPRVWKRPEGSGSFRSQGKACASG